MPQAYRPYLVHLAARERVSPSFMRITLAGDDLGDCGDVLLDQRVKLLLGGPESLEPLASSDDWYTDWRNLGTAQPAMRTYTLRAVRPGVGSAGEVDIDIAVHALHSGTDAPGCRYALEAPLGSPTVLIAADRRHPDSRVAGVAWHGAAAADVLLVGDETALPAVVNICASLGPDVTGRVLLEVPCAADAREFPHPAGVTVTWFGRDEGRSLLDTVGGRADEATASADELVWDEAPETDRCAWLAGEAAWVKVLRAHLKALGYTREVSSVMGYWKRGIAGN